MSLMTRAMSMLNSKLATAAANSLGVVCTPNDGLGSVTLTDWIGTPGRREVDTNTGERIARRDIDERDYIGPVASLTRSGTAFLPTVGMRFVETINGTSYTFESMPASGEAVFDWCDAEKTRVRVRCKRQAV